VRGGRAALRADTARAPQPPFNEAARDAAGFTAAWYAPLAAALREKGAPVGERAPAVAAAAGGAA